MDVVTNGVLFALDGDSGECELAPSERTAASFQAAPSLWPTIPVRVGTRDGVEIAVHANAGSPQDVARAVSLGADGIGLYRTELQFIRLGFIPDEEAQYASYAAAAKAAAGRPVIFRTLDIGGDKPLEGVSSRSRRQSPPGRAGHPAELAAGERRRLPRPDTRPGPDSRQYPGISVMVPMVSRLEELDTVKAVLAEVASDVDVRLGAMVEVPSAAVLAAPLAAEADFLSVGTNDLTAVSDRHRPHQRARSETFSELHPAMLRTLAWVARAGEEEGTPVSVCGELAGDLRALPLLVGLGYRSISLAPPVISRVKARVRGLDTRLLRAPAARAMSATRIRQVEPLIQDLQAVSS